MAALNHLLALVVARTSQMGLSHAAAVSLFMDAKLEVAKTAK